MTRITIYEDHSANETVFIARVSKNDLAKCEFSILEMAVLRDGDQTMKGMAENLRIIITAIERSKPATVETTKGKDQ